MDKKKQLEQIIRDLEAFKQQNLNKFSADRVQEKQAFIAKMEAEKAAVQSKINQL